MEFDAKIEEIALENRDFYVRLLERTDLLSTSKAVAPWLMANTKLDGRDYSFKDHEFQIDIANDDSARVVIKKCSQVGLSELSVRISLARLAMSNSLQLIYVLPSAKFAVEFSKARIDPVIEDSQKLMALLVTAANSATMKRFGKAVLYVGGAASQKQAISRPAQEIVYDEYDFCNQMVLTSYSSRLRHAKDPREKLFSTPTVAGYGVAAEYEASTKKRYMVKCYSCNHEHAPDFNTQVTIPGFDKLFREFGKEDLLDHRYNVNAAYIRCPKCGRSIDTALADALRRRWVSEFPTRDTTGYAVKPFDLIAYNATASIVKQLGKYSRMQDYWNFVQGEEFSSDENEFRPDIIRGNSVVEPQMSGSGYYIGIDVGNKLHVVIGKPVDGKVHVVRKLKVQSTDDQSVKDQLAEIYKTYGCMRGVIDIQPEYDLGLELRKLLGEYFHQCHYVKGRAQDVGHLKVDEDSGVISCARTRSFDQLARKVNKGGYLFPADGEEEEMCTHAQGMKRVDEEDEEGKRVAIWQKVGTGNDHSLHALNYLDMAIILDDPEQTGEETAAMLPDIKGVKIGAGNKPSELDASVRALFKLL